MPAEHWVFVDERYVGDPYCSRYYVLRERNSEYYQRTTVINNIYEEKNMHYVSGPKFEEVQRTAAVPVRRTEIRESNVPGPTVHRGEQVTIYRPAINKTQGNNNFHPAPKRVFNKQEITPPQKRQNLNQRGNQPERFNNQNQNQNHFQNKQQNHNQNKLQNHDKNQEQKS